MIQHPSAKPLIATASHCLKNVAKKGYNKPTEQRRITGQLENLRAFNAITQIKTNAAHVTPLIQEITVPFIIHGT
jgi:hypothetical protein